MLRLWSKEGFVGGFFCCWKVNEEQDWNMEEPL